MVINNSDPSPFSYSHSLKNADLTSEAREKRNTPHRPTYSAASARLHAHTHTHTHRLMYLHQPGYSLFHADIHLRTHTHTHNLPVSWNRRVQVQTNIQATLSSLSLNSGIRFLSLSHTHTHTHTHTLSLCWEAEMSHGPLDWTARGPLGRRERWWKDGPVKPFCCLYCVQAEWRTALHRILNAAYCANFSVNLGQLQHTFSPHNNLRLH